MTTPAHRPLSPAQFARLPGVAPVSEVMVRRWCMEQEMPHTRDERTGRILIEPMRGLAWVKENRRKTDWAGRGGRQTTHRRGAESAEEGMGSGVKPETRNPKPEGERSQRWDSEPGPPAPGTRHPEPEDADAALQDKARLLDPDAALLPEELIRCSVALLQKIRLIEEVLGKRTERLQIEGTLIDAESVKRTWSRTLTSFRRQMNAAAARVADKACALMSAGTADVKSIRGLIDAEFDELLERMREHELEEDEEKPAQAGTAEAQRTQSKAKAEKTPEQDVGVKAEGRKSGGKADGGRGRGKEPAGGTATGAQGGGAKADGRDGRSRERRYHAELPQDHDL